MTNSEPSVFDIAETINDWPLSKERLFEEWAGRKFEAQRAESPGWYLNGEQLFEKFMVSLVRDIRADGRFVLTPDGLVPVSKGFETLREADLRTEYEHTILNGTHRDGGGAMGVQDPSQGDPRTQTQPEEPFPLALFPSPGMRPIDPERATARRASVPKYPGVVTTLNEEGWVEAWRHVIARRVGEGPAAELRLRESQLWGDLIWSLRSDETLDIECLVLAPPERPVADARFLAKQLCEENASATGGGATTLGWLRWGRRRASLGQALRPSSAESLMVAEIGVLIEEAPALTGAVLPELRELLWLALDDPVLFNTRLTALHAAVKAAAPSFSSEVEAAGRQQDYVDGRLESLIGWLAQHRR